MSYTDHGGNRTRDDVAPGQSIITLFSDQKEYLVIGGKCDSYCPLKGDTLSPGAGIIGDNATYSGQKSLKGKTYDTWTWKEILFGVIVMETSVLYVDTTTTPYPAPIQEDDDITPFGQQLGTQVGTFGDLTFGTPDPSLFAFTGGDSCPLNSNCGQQTFQANRLRGNKRWMTWIDARNSMSTQQ